MVETIRTPRGCDIIVDGQVMHLKPAQMESVMHALIMELPQIPQRVKMAWAMRTEPRARIVVKYALIGREIIAKHHMEVFIPNARGRVFFRGPVHILALEAIRRGQELYGKDIEVCEVVHDVISKQHAEKEQEKRKVADITHAMYGMTLEDTMAYVNKHGRLPDLLNASVTE